MTRPLLIVLIALAGCAPVRDDLPGGGTANYLQSAVWFQWGGDFGEYAFAGLHLVGGDYTCDQIRSTDLQWWTLPPETEWVYATMLKGTELDGWDRPFESYAAFEQRGTWIYSDAAYFSGAFGDTANEFGDDDEPPVIGRDQQGYLGQDRTQIEDTLDLRSWSDSLVVGTISGTRTVDGVAEDYSFPFTAENCGVRGNNGQEVPPDGGGDTPGGGGDLGF